MEPKRAPTSLNMAQDGASEGPTCPQQGRKIVKHASALLIFSFMSQNIVFPTVFAWFVVPSSAQDEPRWVPREPKMAQESAKMEPKWSQHGFKMAKDGQVGANLGPHIFNRHPTWPQAPKHGACASNQTLRVGSNRLYGRWGKYI